MISKLGGPDFLDNLEKQYNQIYKVIDGHEQHINRREWLKNNVDYNKLIEYALDNLLIIDILYDYFKNRKV